MRPKKGGVDDRLDLTQKMAYAITRSTILMILMFEM